MIFLYWAYLYIPYKLCYPLQVYSAFFQNFYEMDVLSWKGKEIFYALSLFPKITVFRLFVFAFLIIFK